MLIRLRAPTGQARIDIQPGVAMNQFHEMAATALNLPPGSFGVSLDPAGKVYLASTATLKHGDLVYISLSPSALPSIDASAVSTSSTTTAPSVKHVKMAEIDNLLVKMKGTITRKLDPNFCRHGPTGMCDYCMPIEPYDPLYLTQNKIKHMSFHAHLKSALISHKTAPLDSVAFIPPLEEESFAVKVPCPGKMHEAFPKGICTKCQPSAITLNSQNFRMVDHVEFESTTLIESFIQFWRSTGTQRFGLLYGRYEPYTDKVPLGVKAVVCAIYEPPQENAPQYLQLQTPNSELEGVNAMAKELGLELLGMIYTDLIDDGTGTGKVVCKRHTDSYFLTSAECLFSAHLQSQHPVSLPYSSSGRYGSRFVTVVVSGNLEGDIETSCFQISNVGVGMARDGILEASVEPGLMRVKGEEAGRYVPEVFYTYKNGYGIQVKEAARPTFPVEYLLVTLSHGFPQDPTPTFKSPTPFPIENRNGATSEFPDMSALHASLSRTDIVATLSDFHLLLYISQLAILEDVEVKRLLAVVRQGGEGVEAVIGSGGWQTLVMVAKESAGERGGRSGGGGGGGGGAAVAAMKEWTCRHCTFHNFGGGDCEVCGLPQEG
ncbi:nuclear protein localization protein 4 [Podochytrium sp. JEL0797]|nr:nuclear protein localization protein 4 [Podochytrium sp. JEL0797]